MAGTARRWGLIGLLGWLPCGLAAAAPAGGLGDLPLGWMALLLFAVCVVIGTVAVLAGIGGGVLYVPLISSLFPFHLDFVRGAGLMIALAGSLSSAPRLLSQRLANLHLVLPCALLNSLGALFGATLGLRLPADLVRLLLGVCILVIAGLMYRWGGRAEACCQEAGPIAARLGMVGEYADPAAGGTVSWSARRARWGLPLSFGIGFLAGLFGVGAGWANVPIFHLLMGVPLKVASASSVFLISIGDVSAGWVYLHQGSVLPAIAVPSMLGLMAGAGLGARWLEVAPTRTIRATVLVILVIAGLRMGWLGAAGLLGGGG